MMPLIHPAKNFDLLVLHIPVLSQIKPNQGQNTSPWAWHCWTPGLVFFLFNFYSTWGPVGTRIWTRAILDNKNLILNLCMPKALSLLLNACTFSLHVSWVFGSTRDRKETPLACEDEWRIIISAMGGRRALQSLSFYT